MGGARDPEWSADGRRIVFAASAGGIYEVGSDGRGLGLLRIRGTSPRLSPDGRRLAVMFVTKRELSINVLYRKTGRVTAFRLGKRAVASGPLAWSADGRWLAYGRGREVRDEIGGISTTFDLWYLRLSDGRQRIILRNMDLDGLDWRGR
jgi:Tol biopolymer transport system component